MDASTFAPVATVELELSRRLELRSPLGRSVDDYARARVLVRLHGRPLGLLELDVDRARDTEALAADVRRALGDEIADHLRADGLPVQRLTADGLHAGELPACRRRRAELLADAPHASVVVATRE